MSTSQLGEFVGNLQQGLFQGHPKMTFVGCIMQILRGIAAHAEPRTYQVLREAGAAEFAPQGSAWRLPA